MGPTVKLESHYAVNCSRQLPTEKNQLTASDYIGITKYVIIVGSIRNGPGTRRLLSGKWPLAPDSFEMFKTIGGHSRQLPTVGIDTNLRQPYLNPP